MPIITGDEQVREKNKGEAMLSLIFFSYLEASGNPAICETVRKVCFPTMKARRHKVTKTL